MPISDLALPATQTARAMMRKPEHLTLYGDFFHDAYLAVRFLSLCGTERLFPRVTEKISPFI